MREKFVTHEVANQSPPFADINLFTSDHALQEAVAREGAGHAAKRLAAMGAGLGSQEAFERGRQANENPPRLMTHDAQGHRIDRVAFHSSYDACMKLAIAEGLHAEPWDHLLKPGNAAAPGSAVARAAGCYMAVQTDAGHLSTISMTHAAVATLNLQPDIARRWIPKVLSRTYDASARPAAQKMGVTIGLAFAEKQGGTDLRTIASVAKPAAASGPGEQYVITGHKWFLSAPTCDAFIVLAQAPKGLTCFLMPRVLPDGTTNALVLQRLKDTLGHRSSATGEVEFMGADAWAIGAEGGGLEAIAETVSRTRLDCALTSAGLMRLALANALHHSRHRRAFQKRLVEQPMMAQVLADLAVEVEATTALSFHLARCFEPAGVDACTAAWRRLMTPIAKYWVSKIGPGFAAEAMECLGGNGFVGDSHAARVYRDLPFNALWEGSGNAMALDVLHVLQREPETVEIVLEDLAKLGGDDARLKVQHEHIQAMLFEPRLLDRRGRDLTEALALLAAATLLRAHAPAAVADVFIDTRLKGGRRQTYGQGMERADTRTILERALAT